MRLGTWNVRTVRIGLPKISRGTVSRSQQLPKTALVGVGLNRLTIAIMAFQKTRLLDEGTICEAHYTFFWQGKGTNSVREHGVGFAVRNDLLHATKIPIGISKHIMALRWSSECHYVTLISVYASTLGAAAETRDLFYNQLAETVSRVKTGDRQLILGDFNARVGKNNFARVGKDNWSDCLGITDRKHKWEQSTSSEVMFQLPTVRFQYLLQRKNSAEGVLETYSLWPLAPIRPSHYSKKTLFGAVNTRSFHIQKFGEMIQSETKSWNTDMCI